MTCALDGNDEVSGLRPTRRPVAPRWVYLLVTVATISNACSQAPAPPPYVRVDPTLSTPQEVDSTGSDDADDVEQGPPPEPPTYLSGGFVDLTPNALDMALHPGDIATLDFPEISQGVFADIDQDGQLEVILSAEFEIGQNPNQVLSYDVDSQTLVARPDLSLPTGSIVIAEDLDNDGMTDLLVASGAEPPLHWGLGGGQLAIGTPLSGIELPYREVTTLWLTDVDADGWLDIVAGSNCALIPLLRTRTRSFLARDDLLQGFGVADAYAVMAAPVRAGEMALFSLGHVDCGNLGETLLTPFELNSFGYPLFEPVELYDGEAGSAGFGLTGLVANAPMGSAVSDLNGDGVLEGIPRVVAR